MVSGQLALDWLLRQAAQPAVDVLTRDEADREMAARRAELDAPRRGLSPVIVGGLAAGLAAGLLSRWLTDD